MNPTFQGTLNYGRPPSGIGRPGSGMQQPGSSARMTSSQGQPAVGMGVGVTTTIEVTARPVVMREGMKGMPVRTGVGTSSGYGPERRVVDRSYYVGQLRQKIAELNAETERIKQQEESIHKSSNTIQQLQQRQKSLSDEIAALKAKMSDINFAVEMMNADVETINQQAQSFRLANADQRRNVDKLFLNVKETDGKARSEGQNLENETRNLEERLRSNPRLFAEYSQLRDQMYGLNDQANQMQNEIQSLSFRQNSIMSQLSQDPEKKRAAALVLELLKKRLLRDEMKKECSISIEEERQMLIKQAKSTSQEIDALERQLVEAKDLNEETKHKINSVTEDLGEYQGEKAQKFVELQQKDKEMQSFLDSGKEKEREELDKIATVEKSIVTLLDRISRVQTLKETMPQENAPQMLAALTDEVQEKEKQAQIAKATYVRLQKELQERKEDFEKVAFLDERIAGELAQINQRIEEQQQDIVKYADTEGLRQEAETKKRSLMQRKAELLVRRDSSKQHIHILAADYESKKQALNDNDTHQQLMTQEQKLRVVWQSAYSLEDFVRSKEKEIQYQPTKAETIRLVDELNGLLRDPKRQDAMTAQMK